MITKGVPYVYLRQDARVLLVVMSVEFPSRQDAIDTEPSLSSLWDICTRCWEITPSTRIRIYQLMLQLEHEILERQ